jgi:DNA-binding CsgD family transcriptional regulator/tetratricopeptide (TPR) repeat protein
MSRGVRDSSGEIDQAIALARKAWTAADYSNCLARLESNGLWVDDSFRASALLLRGRTLLRMGCSRQVLDLLGPALVSLTGIESCKARMLYASALARIGEPIQALELLDEVAADARMLPADSDTLAEIAYFQGIGHWIQRNLKQCEWFARTVERARADVLSVRGTQLVAFVESARGDYHRALRTFRRALVAYRSCRNRDNDLAATIRLQIAVLEAQLRSKHITGSHRNARARRVPADSRSFEQSATRCAAAYLDAMQFAHDGNASSAMRKAHECMRLAPTTPWQIYALVVRAIISSNFNERENSGDLLAQAVEISTTVRWEDMRSGESIALLLLAESLARTDPQRAIDCMTRYEAAVRFQERLFVSSEGDARRVAHEAFVRGLVARAAGDGASARVLLVKAQRGFRGIFWLWREAVALIELDATPFAATSPQPFHLENAASIVREHFPKSFVGRRLGRWQNVYADPVAARLLPGQRQILRYALDGYSAKEIATAVGRSTKTVGNQLSKLHEAFGVRTTLQLVAVCDRRGLGTPAWRIG